MNQIVNPDEIENIVYMLNEIKEHATDCGASKYMVEIPVLRISKRRYLLLLKSLKTLK